MCMQTNFGCCLIDGEVIEKKEKKKIKTKKAKAQKKQKKNNISNKGRVWMNVKFMSDRISDVLLKKYAAILTDFF